MERTIFGNDAPIGEARKYVAEYSPSLLIKKGKQRSWNRG